MGNDSVVNLFANRRVGNNNSNSGSSNVRRDSRGRRVETEEQDDSRIATKQFMVLSRRGPEVYGQEYDPDKEEAQRTGDQISRQEALAIIADFQEFVGFTMVGRERTPVFLDSEEIPVAVAGPLWPAIFPKLTPAMIAQAQFMWELEAYATQPRKQSELAARAKKRLEALQQGQMTLKLAS